VSHPAVPEYLSTSLTAFIEIIDHIIGKNRRELFHRQRMIASNAGKLADHSAGSFGYREACHFGYHSWRLADNLRIEGIGGCRNDARQGLLLFIVEEVRALCRESFSHLRIDRSLYDDCLL